MRDKVLYVICIPMAVAALVAAAAAVVASLRFLFTRNFRHDALAVASTEVGLAFLAGSLATGCIAGRFAWGGWWAWDARLTSALVCWLLYAGYLMLRRSVEEPTQRATFAAVFSIFAFIDVPIIVYAIDRWRAPHPLPALWGASPSPGWIAILAGSVAAMLLLGAVMTVIRLRREEAQREADYARRMSHTL